MSIILMDGIELNSIDRTPLDKRIVVENEDELNNMTQYAYPGMIVWVKSVKSSMIAIPSSSGVFSWQPIRKDLEDEIIEARGDEETLNNRFIDINNNITDIQSELADVLPPYSSADVGKFLCVGSDGKLYWGSGSQPLPDVQLTISLFNTNLSPTGHTPGEELSLSQIIYKLTVSGSESALSSVKIRVGTSSGGDNILGDTEVLSSVGTQSTINLESTTKITTTTKLWMTAKYTTSSATKTTSLTHTISFTPLVYFWLGTKSMNDITEDDILNGHSDYQQKTGLPISYSCIVPSYHKLVCCYPTSFQACDTFGYNGFNSPVSSWSKLSRKTIQINDTDYYLYYYDANPPLTSENPSTFVYSKNS